MFGSYVLECLFVGAQPLAPGCHASDFRHVRAEGFVLGNLWHEHQVRTAFGPERTRHPGDGHQLVHLLGSGWLLRCSPLLITGVVVHKLRRPKHWWPAQRARGLYVPPLHLEQGGRTIVARTMPVHAASGHGAGQFQAHGTPERTPHAVRQRPDLAVHLGGQDAPVAEIGVRLLRLTASVVTGGRLAPQTLIRIPRPLQQWQHGLMVLLWHRGFLARQYFVGSRKYFVTNSLIRRWLLCFDARLFSPFPNMGQRRVNTHTQTYIWTDTQTNDAISVAVSVIRKANFKCKKCGSEQLERVLTVSLLYVTVPREM